MTVDRRSHPDGASRIVDGDDAVFAMPPVPEFHGLREFLRGGSTMYKIIRADVGGWASPPSSTGKQEKGVTAAANSNRKKNACLQFPDTRKCSFGDNFEFLHERPAVSEARVPAGGGSRGQRGDGSAGAGGQDREGVSSVLVVRATGGGGASFWDGAQDGWSRRGAAGSG